MRIVIALGGNALLNGEISLKAHEDSVSRTVDYLRDVLESNEVVITHGNGPQVGEEFFRNTLTKDKVFSLTLDYLTAETQGWIGYLLERNVRAKVEKPIATLITLVEVSEDDPAFGEPTKFIGRFLSKEEAEELHRIYGWKYKRDSNRGYRIVVPSPKPIRILNSDAVSNLLDSGFNVIACGGGGVPVIRKDGNLIGVPAVVDKDLASSLLAVSIDAELFVILTQVDRVYLNFGKPEQKPIDRISADELEELHRRGHFPEGSMGPKVEAVLNFVRKTGRKAIITSLENARWILEDVGTVVQPY